MSDSTAKRPHLSLDELQQLKWLLGGVLALLAVWTVSYMDIEAWVLMALTSAGAAACVVWPTLPARLPVVAHTLAFPFIVAFFAGDLWLTGELLPAMVRLDMLLLLYRCVSYRQRRDDLQIVVLGLFLIVVAGVLTVSLIFAGQLLLYTACALLFLLTITLTDAAHGRGAPSPKLTVPSATAPSWAAHADWPRLLRRLRDVADGRVVALAGGLFVGVVAVSALLFLAIPRFQLENSLFLERFVTKKAKSGFSDSIRIGEVTEIQQDTSVALSVDLSDRSQAPASPYWRMLVLDDYTDGVFKLSARLRSRSFRGERTGPSVLGEAKPRLGAAVYWTFYLESGVSRYLPLPGPWRMLRFREPQNFRLGADLGLIELRDEPVTMTAYRVEDFEVGSTLPDPNFARRWAGASAQERARPGLQASLGVGPVDRAQLATIVQEITGGVALPAAAFADKAGAWLRERHSYSLSPVIPSGAGDRLVRWLGSREAGHCELFAGSMVLLARSAGFPARVVTGFRGGSWNAYSNNFTVRNSDAHAWAEVFDPEAGVWQRADALAVQSSQAAESKGEAALARRTDASWHARLESLRVFWYRRIVSFDRQSQEETLRALKSGAQAGGRQLREALADAAAAVREWFSRPWDARRSSVVLGWAAACAALIWAVWNFRYSILDLQWLHVAGRGDPVRREAGRWLARLGGQARGEIPTASRDVVAQLQRLRFGARATWPEPDAVFRRARQALRAARHASVVSSS